MKTFSLLLILLIVFSVGYSSYRVCNLVGQTPIKVRQIVEDAGCWKCGQEEESSFHILCECDALAGVRQRVLGQAYPGIEEIRETELRVLLHFCQSAGYLCELLSVNGAQRFNWSRCISKPECTLLHHDTCCEGLICVPPYSIAEIHPIFGKCKAVV